MKLGKQRTKEVLGLKKHWTADELCLHVISVRNESKDLNQDQRHAPGPVVDLSCSLKPHQSVSMEGWLSRKLVEGEKERKGWGMPNDTGTGLKISRNSTVWSDELGADNRTNGSCRPEKSFGKSSGTLEDYSWKRKDACLRRFKLFFFTQYKGFVLVWVRWSKKCLTVETLVLLHQLRGCSSTYVPALARTPVYRLTTVVHICPVVSRQINSIFFKNTSTNVTRFFT